MHSFQISNTLSQITQELSINAITNVCMSVAQGFISVILSVYALHCVSTCIFDSFDCCGLKSNRGLKSPYQMNESKNHVFPWRTSRNAQTARAVSAKAHGNWAWSRALELDIWKETASTCTRAGQTLHKLSYVPNVRAPNTHLMSALETCQDPQCGSKLN